LTVFKGKIIMFTMIWREAPEKNGHFRPYLKAKSSFPELKTKKNPPPAV